MRGFGVLRKGFRIVTHNGYEIKIPKGTIVRFYNPTPTITFDGYPEIKLIKHEDGKWYAIIFGNPFLVVFDPSNPPYPISYFKN
jgi:hypothetical protein